MNSADLTRLIAETLYLVLVVSAPVLVVSLVVGLAIGLVQAVTQVQEQALSFVPKLAAVALTLAIAGGWMGSEVARFTLRLWTSIPVLIQ